MEEQPIIANVIDITKLKDVSGNENHGDINGPTDIGGKFGRARDFSGSNQNVTVPHDPSIMPSSAITIAFWVKPDSQPATTERFVTKLRTAAPLEGYNVDFNSTNLRFEIILGGAVDVRTVSPPPTGIWTHIACVWEPVTNGMVIYTNGIAGTPLTPSLASIGSTTHDLEMGERDGSDNYDGQLDEVSIFSRALTAAEILTLFQRGSPFIIPKTKVSFFSLTEADEDLLDLATISVFNSGGEFRDHLTIGNEVKVYLQTELDSEPLHIWTGIVKNAKEAHSARDLQLLNVDLADYVYEILSHRQLFDTFTKKDGAQVLKDAIEAKASEIDTSQISVGAALINLTSNGDYVKDLAFKISRLIGYQVGGDRLKRILLFPAGTDDSGVTADYNKIDKLEVRPEDTAIANAIRVQGGEDISLISEQATQTSFFTVTDTTRKLQKIRTPKRKIKEVHIYTDPTQTGSGERLIVRIQADDGTGTAPSDEADPSKDLARKELDSTFLAVGGFTTFLIPDHVLGPGLENWIIVESSGTTGQAVGINGSSNITYRAYYSFPIIELVEDPISIASPLGRREVDIIDPTITTKEEAKERAAIEIAKRALAERLIKFEAKDTSFLGIRTGQGIVLDLPDESISSEKFILHQKKWTLKNSILRLKLDLVEEERLIEVADAIKLLLEKVAKTARAQTQLLAAGSEVVDIFNQFAASMSMTSVAVLTVDTVAGMIWDTDAWDLEVWSN